MCNGEDDDCAPETADGVWECAGFCCGRPAICQECCLHRQCAGEHNRCDRHRCVCEEGWSDCAGACDCNTGGTERCCDGRCFDGDCCSNSDCGPSRACVDHRCTCASGWTDCAGSCDCNTGAGLRCCDGECVDGNCCEDADCRGSHNSCIANECTCEEGWEDCDSPCDCNTGGGSICCFGSACLTGNCCANSDCGTNQICNIMSHTCVCAGGWESCGGTCNCDTSSGRRCCDGRCVVAECCDSGDCPGDHNDCSGTRCLCDPGWIDCEAHCDCNVGGSRDVCCPGDNCERGNCCRDRDCPVEGEFCVDFRCTRI